MKKAPYVIAGMSLSEYAADIKTQIRTISGRYFGENPALPYSLRVISADSFKQRDDGAYLIDLYDKFDRGDTGYSIVSGMVFSGDDKEVDLNISCVSPVSLFLNGNRIFESDVLDEISTQSHRLSALLRPGCNAFTLLCRRTRAGFGCVIAMPDTPVLSPLTERRGMAGWVWSEITETPKDGMFPDTETSESNTNLTWYPLIKAAGKTPQQRIFPDSNGYCVARSRIIAKTENAELDIQSMGKNKIYLSGEKVLECNAGRYTLSVPVTVGSDIHIISECDGQSYGTIITPISCVLEKPVHFLGTDDCWLYMGCFDSDHFDKEVFIDVKRPYKNTYWRTDGNNLFLRPYFEGSFRNISSVRSGGSAFGKWEYPLGVTLYGLLKAALILGDDTLRKYVREHLSACAAYYEYAVWDRQKYGQASVLQHLTRLTLLDDCGSMGSAMLECYKTYENKDFEKLSKKIMDFISDSLEKLPNGAFYRLSRDPKRHSTLWADDLYMSVPFLCRRYSVFGDGKALELAAKQFLLFKEYLFMPENGVLAHVYDMDTKTATGVAWGRGNGWAVFSLAELLAVIPKDHKLYTELREFFIQLSDAWLRLQDDKGFWHQVLDDHESYEETSCTSMGIYALCTGARLGIYDNPEKYTQAAKKAWKALTDYSIDRNGNIHAVCKGSNYSFTKEYYKNDLFWVTNDHHGTGIVLLAGAALLSLD